MLILTKEDHEKTFMLQEGEKVCINLHENPTTGYMWIEEKIGLELELTSHSSFGGIELVGSGRTASFEFKMKEKGTTVVELHLKRKWEAEAEPVDIFKVEFKIEKREQA